MDGEPSFLYLASEKCNLPDATLTVIVALIQL